MTPLLASAGTLLSGLPIVLICVIGLYLAYQRRVHSPKAMRWAMAGFVAVLLQIVALAASQAFITAHDTTPANVTEYATQILFINLGIYVLRVAGVAFLAIAALSERKPPGHDISKAAS
jgi:uncharacterized membrane protein YhhN